MKKNGKKLQLHTETLRRLEGGELRNVGGGTETRGFTNCAYCYSEPITCPTSIVSVDSSCG